ncbi:MAG TPA: hypothetical protein VLH10_12055, partial [Yinghuangia sp.]|nr:hypothetical protein [Yinghuangia sp.]
MRVVRGNWLAGVVAVALAGGLSGVGAAGAATSAETAPSAASEQAAQGWLVDSPEVGLGTAVPVDVSTAGTTTIAVGYARPDGVKQWQPLALHREQGAWVNRAVPVPEGTSMARLHAVLTLSRTDAWAAGYAVVDGAMRPWIVHWDGTAWTTADTSQAADGALYGISGDSGGVWAVGESDAGASVLRLVNGTWQQVTLPPDLQVNWFTGVSARGANDLWVVGPENMSAHWNGHGWTKVPVPAVGGQAVWLENVRTSALQGTWAVGYRVGEEGRTPTALRWDGQAWRQSELPLVKGQFDDIAFTADGPVAVGAADGAATPTGERGYAVRLPSAGRPAREVSVPGAAKNLHGAAVGPA